LKGAWTHRSITLSNRRSRYIELGKWANSFTRVNGSPGTTLNKKFLTSWRLSIQWGFVDGVGNPSTKGISPI